MTSDIIVYDAGEIEGPRVLVRTYEGRAVIVVESRGRSLTILPAVAAQVASGLDAAIDRIDRSGRLRRPA